MRPTYGLSQQLPPTGSRQELGNDVGQSASKFLYLPVESGILKLSILREMIRSLINNNEWKKRHPY